VVSRAVETPSDGVPSNIPPARRRRHDGGFDGSPRVGQGESPERGGQAEYPEVVANHIEGAVGTVESREPKRQAQAKGFSRHAVGQMR